MRRLLYPEYPVLRLTQIVVLINGLSNGYTATVEPSTYSADRKYPGQRYRFPGKVHRGNELTIRDPKGGVVFSHNTADSYRRNGEILRWVEERWGKIWEKKNGNRRAH
jgi:hypothetical protein